MKHQKKTTWKYVEPFGPGHPKIHSSTKALLGGLREKLPLSLVETPAQRANVGIDGLGSEAPTLVRRPRGSLDPRETWTKSSTVIELDGWMVAPGSEL